MMRRFLKALKYLSVTVLGVILVIAATVAVLYLGANRSHPEINIPEIAQEPLNIDGYTSYGESRLIKSRGDLWELHLKGSASQRGLAMGELCRDMMYRQERAFVNEIRRMIPSEGYLNFLKYLAIIFNRDLSSNIPLEYREEIYAASLACSNEFDFIGSAYERQLNYHAAHDLGHAMQEYMLVGCSSFGVWGGKTADSSLLIGRNFDFYVGEEFAKEKVISFFYPDSGYCFTSVSWAGMFGVLSGMNEKGLTITLNAARSAPPTSSKTPISIIAREILQYASTIDEAYEIAGKMEAFVSESLLIGSAKDGVAAIIEKSPKTTRLFRSAGDMIISTNHFQSEEFLRDSKNRRAAESIPGSHSMYRYMRLEQLISKQSTLSPEMAAAALRDYRGLHNKEIGLTNEMSINQFIAHHAVIFEPEKLLMWVSSSDWQLGEMVAYDLGRVFRNESHLNHLRDERSIAADTVTIKNIVPLVREYRRGAQKIRDAIKSKRPIEGLDLQRFLEINPHYYHTYELLGDHSRISGEAERAALFYGKALKMEIPYTATERSITKKLKQSER